MRRRAAVHGGCPGSLRLLTSSGCGRLPDGGVRLWPESRAAGVAGCGARRALGAVSLGFRFTVAVAVAFGHPCCLAQFECAMAPGSKRPLGSDGVAAARRRRLMAAAASGGSTTPLNATPPSSPAPGNGATSGAGRTFSDADVDAIVGAFLVAQTSNGRNLTDADAEAVAGVVCKKLEEGALSARRVTEALVDPVADAAATSVDKALSAFEARQPSPANLAKMISDPVVEEVKRAMPPL